MDAKFAESLREGARVAVFMGAAVADLYGHPPMVTTGTVMGPTGPPYDTDKPRYWIAIDVTEEQLPQMYAVEEIIGFLMPQPIVTRSADGQFIEARIPDDYVGP